MQQVESSWNVMGHADAREGKRRGNWRIQWVASTLHTTSEHGVSNITTADAHTSAASSRLNWRPPADLNGLVRFAERRNLVSARVPSHFNWPLTDVLTRSTKDRFMRTHLMWEGVWTELIVICWIGCVWGGTPPILWSHSDFSQKITKRRKKKIYTICVRTD